MEQNSSAALAAASEKACDAVDVVIVGAGLTGLSLADRLLREGWRVRVLEARDRVGGRMLSRPHTSDASGYTDLGATWFWPGEDRVRALVDRFVLGTHVQYIEGDALFETTASVRRLPGNPIDGEGPTYRLAHGTASLTVALAAACTAGAVLLNSPVHSVSVGPDGMVEVTFAMGSTVHARYVVLALPPALAVNRIRIQPPLSSQLHELATRTAVWMGGMTKVIAEFRLPFWRETGLNGAAASHVGPIQELHDMSGADGTCPALLGFAPSPVSREAVLAQLVSLFGSTTTDHLVALTLQDWRSEEWTTPAGTALAPGRTGFGHALYRTPAHGCIWLASTETAPSHAGHMEGALAAADLVGDAIVALLKRP
jgi:monoamine oxidase